MADLLAHVKDYEDHHLFFVEAKDHHDLVWWAIQQRMSPVLWESSVPTDDETERPIEGVWYFPNVDDNGFEWHFVDRDNLAMLFKLKVG